MNLTTKQCPNCDSKMLPGGLDGNRACRGGCVIPLERVENVTPEIPKSRYYWDLFRWRFVAIYWIGSWVLRGMPIEHLPKATRRENLRLAYQSWRDLIMHPHEKERCKSLDELVVFYKSTRQIP